MVESNAGAALGFDDSDYEAAGAKVASTHEEVFATADLIVKVKEPLASECKLLRKGQILFTYLHLAANRPLTECLLATGATCIAYETVEVNHRLPLLEPMSEIAGRMSVLVGGYFLAKHNGGKGVLSRRCSWSSAGTRGGFGRRQQRNQCRAHGHRTWGRCDDP